MRPSTCAVLIGLLLTEVALTGQAGSGSQGAAAPPPGSTQDPSFRSAVRLVDVDVIVTDREGRFVHGLTRDDFEILEDKAPQTITTFSITDLPLPDPTEAAADGTDGPEPDVTTNRTPLGRVYVILMDSPSTAAPPRARESITYDAYARQFANQFVEEAVASGDAVAVVHVQGTFTDSQAFTTNRSLVQASIGRYGQGQSGAGLWHTLSGVEKVHRQLDTFRAIEDLAARLGAMSGRRKVIIWLGGQIVFDPSSKTDCSPAVYQDQCALSRSAGTLLAAYRDAIGAATRNNVAIYPVDPSGLTVSSGQLERTAALRMVAEDTGGLAVVGTNDFTRHFQTIARDTSTYYVLGYTPAVEHRDGRFHEIAVRVKRPGLTVRARRGYYAPAPDAAAPALPPLPEGVSRAAWDALRMPLPVSGLSVDVFTAPFKGRAHDDSSVVIGGQITGDLRLEKTDAIALSYQVFTLEGDVHTGEYKVFDLNLQPDTRAGVEDAGLRFVDRIALPPGRYELRLVADQPGGSLGSVVTSLEVPEFDTPLAVSGLVLAASGRADDLTLHDDPPLREALRMDPTAVRRFDRSDLLAIFAEVYSNDVGLTADDVAVTVVVTTPDGDEVKQEVGWLDPLEPGATGPTTGWSVTTELALGEFSPGPYVLALEVVWARQPNRPVRRRIPFRVEE